MKKPSLVFGVCVIVYFCAPLACAKEVAVGGYLFPPFVEGGQGNSAGLTIDLIKKMNAFQNKYQFVFVRTSSTRRYEDFIKGEFDVIMFESINWGWQKIPDIQATNVFLKGGEVYITKADASKDQTYFDSFKGKSIACILGYHYGFAGFNADENFMTQKYNVQLSSSPRSNILKVINGSADIAVVTISYLDRFLNENPDFKKQLLVSDKLDQQYNHTILVRRNSAPDVNEMNKLLDDMQNAGLLSALWRRYGIKDTCESSNFADDSCESAR